MRWGGEVRAGGRALPEGPADPANLRGAHLPGRGPQQEGEGGPGTWSRSVFPSKWCPRASTPSGSQSLPAPSPPGTPACHPSLVRGAFAPVANGVGEPSASCHPGPALCRVPTLPGAGGGLAGQLGTLEVLDSAGPQAKAGVSPSRSCQKRQRDSGCLSLPPSLPSPPGREPTAWPRFRKSGWQQCRLYCKSVNKKKMKKIHHFHHLQFCM